MAKQTMSLALDTTSIPSLLFLSAIAAAITWIVLISKGANEEKTSNGASDSKKTFGMDSRDQIIHTSTACYQAVVVAILLYIAFKME